MTTTASPHIATTAPAGSIYTLWSASDGAAAIGRVVTTADPVPVASATGTGSANSTPALEPRDTTHDRSHFMRRTALIPLALAASVALAGFEQASAHPLGNLTTNTSTEVVLSSTAVSASIVLDLAELPTVQARQRIDDVGVDTYATEMCTQMAAGLQLRADGATTTWNPSVGSIEFPPGQGGLDTLRLTCDLTSQTSLPEPTEITVTDTNFSDRIGWRELYVVSDGVQVTSGEVTTSTATDRLRSYPADDTASLRQTSATFTVAPGGPRLDPSAIATPTAPAGPLVRESDGLTARFNRLVGDRQLTVALALACAALAFALGGIHALAPGHGKTLMAAAVISRRGTMAQVVGIGVTVAVTHTAGVLALGSIIWLSQTVAPDQVLPWLTVASGALLTATGAGLLYRRLSVGAPAHGHHHGIGHHHHGGGGHHHGAGGHVHELDDTHHSHSHDGVAPLRRRWVVAMGVAGGLVPTPSALVVLLGATALGRAWFGVVLVAIYGLGMAATLLAAGLLLVRVQYWLERRWYGTRWLTFTMRVAPVVTSLALVTGGLSIATRGAIAT